MCTDQNSHELQSLKCQQLLSKIPLGLCVVDADLVIRDWNPQLEKWTGVKASQVKGQVLTSRFPETEQLGVANRIRDVLKIGTPAVFSWSLHRQFLDCSDSAPLIHRSLIQDTRVVRVSQDPPLALITISDETTAAEQLVQLRQDRQDLLSAKTSLQTSCIALEEKNQKLQKEIADRQQAESELRRQTAEFISAKVRETEHTRHLEQLVRDLTKARQAAEVAARAKSEFLANMSHEIRTPMTAILGYVDLLEDLSLSADERAELMTSIRRNGNHLTEIVDDILDISKIEAGKMLVDTIVFSPESVIDDVVQMMSERARIKGLELHTQFMEPVPVRVQSDPTRFRQILINLVGNAIKFTTAGSVRITVEWQSPKTERGKLLVHVKDTGVGIPPHRQEEMFAPFVQADTQMTRQYGGTGLGLAISQRLARILGGDLTFTSQEGKGSTFTVLIPCPEEAAINEPAHQNLELAPKKTQPANPLADTRILIVDDTADNRKLLSFHVKKAGAVIDLAENGQEALDKITEAKESRPYDIILMDMQMPVLDGYEATKQLRKHGDMTPVIAVTAHAMAGDRDKCLSAGCNDYITKPVAREKLLQMMQQWLQASIAFTGQ